MKKTARIIAVLLAIVMLAAALAACGSDDQGGGQQGSSSAGGSLELRGREYIFNNPIKIMVIIKSTGFVAYRLYQMALNDQALRYPNVTIDYKDSEFDVNKQITLIEEAVTQGYDAILLEAMDPIALNNAIDEAEKAGVPVITCNGPEPTGVHSYHIAGADYSSGWTSGEMLDEMTRGQSNRTAIILDCPALQKPGARMGTGFEDYITQKTDIKLLEPPIGIENWSPENAQVAMRDMLTKYGPGEITMVYCSSDDMATGALNALEATGRTGDVLVWGNIGYPIALEAVRDGRMAGTMFSDTYVEFSVMFYAAMHHIALGLTAYTGGFEDTPFLDMPLLPVTPQNVENIMAVSRWYS